VDLSFLPQVAFTFLLIFARLGGIMMLAPGIGESSVPVRLRLAFSLTLALMFYPVLSNQFGAAPLTMAGGLMLFGYELLVGLFLGITTRLMLSALSLAGTVIAFQTGLAFAQNVDPAQGTQGALFGNFLTILALTMIFTSDLHHVLIAGIISSYDMLPPGGAFMIGDAAQVVLKTVADSFRIGMQISTPFLVFGFVFYFGLGVLSKLMPQLQVFFVAMPLNILLGYLLFAVLLGAMMIWFLDYYETSINALFFGF
jgi:flagellar biosynthetic protein FliR